MHASWHVGHELPLLHFLAGVVSIRALSVISRVTLGLYLYGAVIIVRTTSLIINVTAENFQFIVVVCVWVLSIYMFWCVGFVKISSVLTKL